MKVREIMTTNVTTARENSTLREVADQMKSLNVGCIPVCDSSNRPIGIVTDRDIVLRSVASGSNADEQVRNVMSSSVISVSPDTDVHEAARIMAENQIRRLPVVENGKLVGILAIGDLAVRNIYVNEAGDALSSISQPSNTLR